jgi:hypothetical protein
MPQPACTAILFVLPCIAGVIGAHHGGMLRWGPENFLPGLALNYDPPSLLLPSRQYYSLKSSHLAYLSSSYDRVACPPVYK